MSDERVRELEQLAATYRLGRLDPAEAEKAAKRLFLQQNKAAPPLGELDRLRDVMMTDDPNEADLRAVYNPKGISSGH